MRASQEIRGAVFGENKNSVPSSAGAGAALGSVQV